MYQSLLQQPSPICFRDHMKATCVVHSSRPAISNHRQQASSPDFYVPNLHLDSFSNQPYIDNISWLKLPGVYLRSVPSTCQSNPSQTCSTPLAVVTRHHKPSQTEYAPSLASVPYYLAQVFRTPSERCQRLPRSRRTQSENTVGPDLVKGAEAAKRGKWATRPPIDRIDTNQDRCTKRALQDREPVKKYRYRIKRQGAARLDAQLKHSCSQWSLRITRFQDCVWQEVIVNGHNR